MILEFVKNLMWWGWAKLMLLSASFQINRPQPLPPHEEVQETEAPSEDYWRTVFKQNEIYEIDLGLYWHHPPPIQVVVAGGHQAQVHRLATQTEPAETPLENDQEEEDMPKLPTGIPIPVAEDLGYHSQMMPSPEQNETTDLPEDENAAVASMSGAAAAGRSTQSQSITESLQTNSSLDSQPHSSTRRRWCLSYRTAVPD